MDARMIAVVWAASEFWNSELRQLATSAEDQCGTDAWDGARYRAEDGDRTAIEALFLPGQKRAAIARGEWKRKGLVSTRVITIRWTVATGLDDAVRRYMEGRMEEPC